jgi:hypothetical protein
MKRVPASPERAAPPALAHWAVSAIALAGVIAVQIDWDSLGDQAASGRPAFSSVILIMATAWLLATAWLHALLARQDSQRIGAGRLAVHALADLAVGAMAIFVVLQGHQSAAASGRLWAMSPALLAVSFPSAVVLMQAPWRNRSLGSDAPPERFDWIRLVIAAALLVVLAWIAAATAWRGP